ncbi:hypothetical protein C8R47DRAFT_965148 [Mycena vitilis]|nr:hypothetical protein C8R47DRAFT_965148 [Mycena vitilis]
MDSQATKTSTFSAPPLDGSLTMPQLLDHHLEMSPCHKAYTYDDGKGGVVSVQFAQYVRTVYAACQRILYDTESVSHKTGAVVALFADTGATVVLTNSTTPLTLHSDTLSYCMLVSAIMRAGLVPFCLSPRNAAVGVANLLEQTTPVAVYISPDLRSVITDALNALGTPLPVYEAPTFEQLQGALVNSLPALPKAEMDSIAYILHTSDISHKFLLQFGSPPWKDSEDHSGQVLAVHNVPNYHGIGVFVACWPLTSGLTMSVFRPTIPPLRMLCKSLALCNRTCLIGPISNGIIATNPEFVMATPATVETWSESSCGLAMMKSRKALTYLGAPLNKRVGDALVANGVVLCSTYGAMETGLVAPFLEHHGADWDYISMRSDIEVARVPEEDGSSLYTHTYLVSSSFTTSYTNSVIDGRPGCSVSDLLERHPHKPELHRIYGRKDDILIFSSGLKVLPIAYDCVELLIRNPVVNAALIFGHTLPYPGVLVQLKPDFQDHLVDDAKRANVCDIVWTSVEEVNQTSPAHFQIPRKMILLADPGKPFALTSKLQPRRQVVFEHYQAEIRAAYL